MDLMSRSRWWFVLSLAVLAVALVGLVRHGLNFGLEFTGGRLIEYSTARSLHVGDLRAGLAASGFPRAVAQESGDGNVSIRAGRLSEADEARIRAAVEALGGDADKVRDEFIGPTIGEELRRKAAIALGLGLGAQLLYLALRFRWTYGGAAVIAMFHDVMILLGVFAWLQKDVDGVFVAALLTVVGYSINDSVVVFDRIREQRRQRAEEPLSAVANDACLHTIPRTINTGLGALFILVTLHFLGGETLTDFALALIVGILLGTYSSVFTAAPLAVVLERLAPAPAPASSQPSAREVVLRRAREERTTADASAGSASSPTTSRSRPPGRRRVGEAKRKRRRRR
jgi:SecD/SecF fusion protein